MLLTQTASSAPNVILIGAGLVWQTLPAGWADTSESHYMSWHVANWGALLLVVEVLEAAPCASPLSRESAPPRESELGNLLLYEML